MNKTHEKSSYRDSKNELMAENTGLNVETDVSINEAEDRADQLEFIR